MNKMKDDDDGDSVFLAKLKGYGINFTMVRNSSRMDKIGVVKPFPSEFGFLTLTLT